jgi:hypothetical protein
MPSSAEDFWNQLSQPERDRRIAYYDRTARRAYSHCCSILIGCPLKPITLTRSGTGVHISVDSHDYVITAGHVVEELRTQLKLGPAHFQIGQLVINPWSRIVYEDKKADIVVIAIDSEEVVALGSTSYKPVGKWPPAPPKDGDFVHLCGFAAANRKNGMQGTINSFSLHLFGQVAMGLNETFFVTIDRTGIPTENVGLLPSPGTPLGGMSGGPVMLHFDEPLPLIGVTTQMSCLVDAIGVYALSSIRLS